VEQAIVDDSPERGAPEADHDRLTGRVRDRGTGALHDARLLPESFALLQILGDARLSFFELLAQSLGAFGERGRNRARRGGGQRRDLRQIVLARGIAEVGRPATSRLEDVFRLVHGVLSPGTRRRAVFLLPPLAELFRSRAAFLPHPLGHVASANGHVAGKRLDIGAQRLRQALRLLQKLAPGFL
jgi:hypothetical protein